ncbi:PAS domain S-box-containing protein [Methanomicrobium sp. W14]|uniref:PAS domain S-box protein n=1 Tax=Methanomicrobium sp. W14 TaxID=2817839 RepID=UPI001AE71FAE|nr:PAS domain S-box protein [Methanomicrobium sp. W14]MBP2133827.1 PAS domain S-box-containing protein [Methanomicrobium sp. W14]
MIRVLHVDDDPSLVEIAKIFLEKDGDILVKTAFSGSNALEILKGESFDAIVSDYEMPALNGIEFLKRLRAEKNDTPFIIFSGRGREDVLIDAINNGADFYLQKGGRPKSQFAELKNMILQSVKRKTAESALRDSEERYRAVVESQTELICRFLPDGTLKFANDAFCRYYGLNPRDYPGKKFVSGDLSIGSMIREHLKKLSPGSPYGDIEHEFVMSGGEVRWQNWTDRAFFDKNGNIIEYQSVGRDVTEERFMKQSLQEKVNYVSALMDTIPAPVFYRDTKGVYYDCNRAFEDLVGLSRKDIIGKNIYDFFDKDLADLYSGKDREIIENPHIQQYENEINNSKGERIDVLFSKTARFRANWTVDGIVGVIFDISNRKKMENEIVEEINFIQALKDSIPAPVFYRDREGIYHDCNRAFEDLVGLSKKDIIGKNIYDFFDKDLADVYSKKDREIIENPHVQRYEYAINNSNGDIIDVLFSKTALFSADGTVSGVVGVILDISDRKKMERALRESEEKFRTLADYTYDWESWIGPDGNMIYMSPSCFRITGYPVKDFLSDTVLMMKKIVHPDDLEMVLDHYRNISEADKSIKHFDFRIFTASGEMKWISHYCQPVYHDDGRWAGRRETKRDITLRKEYEDRLSKLNEKLNLLSSVTRHDVLNQVTALNGYIELLKEPESYDSSVTGVLEKIEMITSTIKHQILFTKDYQETGIHSPSWQNLFEVFNISKSMFDTGSLLFEVNVDSNLEIYADPLLGKVFYNFIDNSVRHGGQNLSILRLSSVREEKSLKIIYEDNGEGILQENKKRIFLKGFGENTGYGLFLIQYVLSITGLLIEECGDYGKGVRFEITVPEGKFKNSC